jgi:glycosyltransferase 2 family protein
VSAGRFASPALFLYLFDDIQTSNPGISSLSMKLRFLIKPLLSLIMVGLILALVDLKTLWHTLLNIPLHVALLAVVGYSLTQVVNSVKWWLLARAGNIRVPWTRALRANFAGMFANCFSLGTVTGDMLRGVLLAQGQRKRTEAIVSVFADRALGLSVLSMIGVLATAFVSGHHMQPAFVWTLFGVSAAILAGWFIGPFVVLRLVPKGNAFRDKIQSMTEVFAKDPFNLLIVCLISAVFHLMQISLQWQIARGIGIEVSFASMLLTVPFVNILSTLPISWNGLGVRENAYIVLLANVFTKEQSLAVGAIWFFGLTASGLIGGMIAILSGDIRKGDATLFGTDLPA